MVNPDKEQKSEVMHEEEQLTGHEQQQEEEAVVDTPEETGEPPQTEASERKWYVLRVQSGKEDRVKVNLEKRVEAMGMQDLLDHIQSVSGYDPTACAQAWLRSEPVGPTDCP